MNKLPHNNISVSIRVHDGSILLLDMLARKDISNQVKSCNIFKVSLAGNIEWQIQAQEPVTEGAPFTGVAWEEGELHAYRWDGTEFLVDAKTGIAKPLRLSK